MNLLARHCTSYVHFGRIPSSFDAGERMSYCSMFPRRKCQKLIDQITCHFFGLRESTFPCCKSIIELLNTMHHVCFIFIQSSYLAFLRSGNVMCFLCHTIHKFIIGESLQLYLLLLLEIFLSEHSLQSEPISRYFWYNIDVIGCLCWHICCCSFTTGVEPIESES